jgi:iron complex outermembrane receptor protein
MAAEGTCLMNTNSKTSGNPGNLIFSITRTILLMALVFSLSFFTSAVAQEDEETERGASSTLMEEITVTARKREESLQQVPISVSAYNGDQIEALKVRDLKSLTVAMPNVAMDDIGTSRGVANFSIRGLGINSSIPGIDPTVGVFIDGVYLGSNAATVLDIFDIESIEVLRGPQGTLFGRNVTGGAVLINSKGPSDELEVSLRGAVEANPSGAGGWNNYVMGSVSGPLGDTFGARVSLFHNEDHGWFENLYDGADFGKARTTIFRPVLSWEPTEELRMLLRWEHMETSGDGPPAQTHTNGSGVGGFFANFDRDSFDFSIDEPGFIDIDMDFVTFQLDWDVAFGDGTITNIFGYRDFTQTTYADIDAQPVWLFHSGSISDYHQYSNELRYNGSFGNANVTAGVYWYKNETVYSEIRDLLGYATGDVAPALTQHGGGILELKSLAGFAAVDYMLNDAWALNAGIRYTSEDKDAQIATLTLNVNSPCLVALGQCTYDFVDGDTWNAWSGKLGVTYQISDDMRSYLSWSRGHRSGGYNLRNTAIDTVNFGPGPFDQETVDSIELGFKTELGGRGRLNGAVFYTSIEDMQREVNQSDPFAGVVQVIKNTADAKIWGFELEGTFALGDSTALLASVGYANPKYDSVFFDLNGDGVVDQSDEDLKLPRAAPWTYSIGITHDWFLDQGSTVTVRANYAHRDAAFYTDNNLGYFLSQNILEAGLDFALPGRNWVFSLYGKNLLNSVNHGGDTQLPSVIGPVPTGGTFSPLTKGRAVGFEVTFNYQ